MKVFSGGHLIDLHNSEAFQKRVGGLQKNKVYKKREEHKFQLLEQVFCWGPKDSIWLEFHPRGGKTQSNSTKEKK